MARGARARPVGAQPDVRRSGAPASAGGFSVTVIGAGLGGLNVALMLKRAGIPFSCSRRTPASAARGGRTATRARAWTRRAAATRTSSASTTATPTRSARGTENERYFHWVADTFELRDDIVFETEVRSLTWDEDAASGRSSIDGPDGERTVRSNAVITAVGFLNRPKLPEIEGMDDFRGPSWHTARWPEDLDVKGKRVAVIGTGCTGYQMIPELALEDGARRRLPAHAAVAVRRRRATARRSRRRSTGSTATCPSTPTSCGSARCRSAARSGARRDRSRLRRPDASAR